jgi:endonuclease/exonuclease/phosphatase (EEP) superfamily protein YafD
VKRRVYFSGVAFLSVIGLFTLLGFGADYGFFPDIVSHFRFQYALGAIVSGVIFTLLKKRMLMLASLIVLIINLSFVVPLYFATDASLLTTNPTPVRLLLMNVLSSNEDTEAVVAEIHRYRPDIVVLEEITPRWFAALSDQLTDYPYQLHAVREDNFGIWLLSKFPVSDEEIIPWGPAQLPSATVRFRIGDQLARVVGMHPMSPGDPQGVRWRNEQLRQIAAHFQAADDPLLVIGDLNTTSFIPIFQEFKQALRLADSRRGFGLQCSWPAFSFNPLMISLDHCLVSKDWKVVRHELGDNVGSDHLPVYVELNFLDADR